MNEKNDISSLLYKAVIGKLSENESIMLQQWIEESKEHKLIYERLTDAEYLKKEYKRRQQINYERPFNDMNRRIRASHSVVLKRWITGIAAAVACICCYQLGQLATESNMPTEQVVADNSIKPGSTKAELTLSDGSIIDLEDDTEINTKAIAKSQSGERKEESKANMNKLVTPKGGEFKIVLEDGTIVWLNSESQLYYPEKFNDAERRVKLIGEAFFKVAKDDNKPFFVESGKQIVKVYGTEFNINYYNENANIYTTLINGKISLMQANENAELVLTPGHQAIFNKNSTETTLRSVDTETVSSWKNGMFVFEEQNLEQIMYTLGRWYDFTFEFSDNAAKQIVFKGKIPRSGSFDNAVEILEMSGGLKFEITGNHVKIRSKRM